MGGVRCFVAFDLPAELLSAYSDAGDSIRAAAAEWRAEKWVARENLHVTLKFMGSIAGESVDALVSDLDVVFASAAGFELPVTGVRAVPGTRRCSMLWGTLGDPDGAAMRLAGAIDSAAESFGVERDERTFKPHVTLVRARRPRRIDSEVVERASALVTASCASVSVAGATFYSSMLTKHGPIYEPMARWQF